MNYDLLVIGGGPGGCRAAEYAAANGLKTALFEKEELDQDFVVCGPAA